MTQAISGDEAADEITEIAGYEAELKRTLNGFQMFAISFASVSVVIGIFAAVLEVEPGRPPA